MAEEREYGVAASFDFPLIVFSSTDADFSTAAVLTNGDIRLSQDGSTLELLLSTGAAIGINSGLFTVALTSTEMQFARAIVLITDTDATKIFEDQAILLTTYGSTSGLHAFNRNSTGVSVDSIGTGAITSTAIAADAILSTGIATAAFIAEKFGVGFLESTGIADAAITSDKFALGAISSGVVSTGQMEEAAATVWDRVLTGGTHNINNSAGRRLRQLQEAGGYTGGAVYIDTVNGSAGTTNFENGVETNPVDSIADANTIAASVGLSRFMVAPGSIIAFVAAQENQVFNGHNWTLALGGQSVAGSHIQGADITGIAIGADPEFEDCSFNSTYTLPASVHHDCRYSGTLTLGSSGDYTFIDGAAELVGGAAPIIDYSTSAFDATVNYRRYSGGLTANNLSSGDILGIEIVSGGPVTLNGAEATVVVAGIVRAFTNNLTGSPNVITNGLINLANINAEMVDVVNVDLFGDPITTTDAPPVSNTITGKVGYLYGTYRNRIDASTSEKTFYTSTGGIAFTKPISDTGTYIELAATT